ncbi:MAG: hypothetical protein ACMUIL_00620 [bacterium]
MKTIIFVGFILLGFIPIIIILNLFLYKLYHNFAEKSFENNNCIVLTNEKICDVLENCSPSKSIMIFKSAICDNCEVEGLRYYTKYPFGSNIVTAHDNHRRAIIAFNIGQMLSKGKLDHDDMNLCADILICLTNYTKETYYTQLFAWQSLVNLFYFQKEALLDRITIDYIKASITRNFQTGIGPIKFIFDIKAHKSMKKNSEDFIKEIILFAIRHAAMPLRALLVFKLNKSPHFDQTQKTEYMKNLPKNREFERFLMQMKVLSFGFAREELEEGIKNLGLQPPPYSSKTTEGEIVQLLLKDFIEEIYVPVSYLMHNYDRWDIPRHQSGDFLWY